ncbi:MAG: hypothetical protein Greene101449_435 [Candidatus Peregrinibacteria bacterium Greene1014_49]|nr:MAG: hypothetical protein Greene101449_435 [Candidatus Peregrinibacteria bacterium Greene1014_49]
MLPDIQKIVDADEKRSLIAIGKVIHGMREQQRMSIETLAARSKMTPEFIAQAECGNRAFSHVWINRVMAVLGVGIGPL